MNTLYTVDSLEGLAMIYEQRAVECERKANRTEIKKHKEAFKAEASAWFTAADIARNTKIDPNLENQA
jgi:hypothetical protein